MSTHFKHTLHRVVNIVDQEGFDAKGSLKGFNPELEIEIEVAVHKANSGKIIINYPGAGGHIDGYNNKYLTLADCMQNSIGAVVRMGNQKVLGLNYSQLLRDNLKAVIEYSISNAFEICGSHKPILYLMGSSDGAGAISAVAYLYAEIEKILLYAPSFGAGREDINKGLKQYRGDLYIVIGNKDFVVGQGNGQIFKDLAEVSRISQLEIIPDCDHQFRGKTNGKILSKAPFWAFDNDGTFPSPEGGIELYE